MAESLIVIADRLANVLRHMPCTCKPKDSWPAFANEARVITCRRCAALAEYDAHNAIVQTPITAAREALRRAADSPGERHD